MQTQDLIIIATCLALGLALVGFFIFKGVRKAFDRVEASHTRAQTESRYQIDALNHDIERLDGIRRNQESELQAYQAKTLYLKANPFTLADHQTLMDIAHSLRLAHDTWKAIPGCETTQAKAAMLIRQAKILAYRTFSNVTATTALNGEPLDTQIIEWLDKRGTLYTEPELSSISFPHDADTYGYKHLRDALREAYELDKKRQAIELGQLPAEHAA